MSKSQNSSNQSRGSGDKARSVLKVDHFQDKNIYLMEDSFGNVTDERGITSNVRRFTWKNHNKIEAQVITYGARVTTLKLPNRKGYLEDVILGFDDIAGYLYYDKYYVGATIGRVTNKVENATFPTDGKQFWLSKNAAPHHYNGGFKGFDKINWSPHVEGTKVLMSHVSLDGDEGYPGDLLVRITYELTSKNEFKIDMEAICTKPTIVNLSNMLYFNMAGHEKGDEELYKHYLTLNANCYTPLQDNAIPIGVILNVIHTCLDFQIPKLVSSVVGITPDDGINENFCVNRGADQENCFVARLLHSPSGRMVEIYSNQPGLNVSTCNDFGFGVVDIPSDTSKDDGIPYDKDIFDIVQKLHSHLADKLALEDKKEYAEIRELIRKIQTRKFPYSNPDGCEIPASPPPTLYEYVPSETQLELTPQEFFSLALSPLQVDYLTNLQDLAKSVKSTTDYFEINKVIQKILDTTIPLDPLEVEKMLSQTPPEEGSYTAPDFTKEKKKKDAELKRKGMIRLGNKIPRYYQDGRIHGKNNVIYKRHCAICMQTQNYPNAIHYKDFPNCELKPGETYKHSITYKFWIQGGNPNKWIKRNFPEKK